MTNKQLYKRLVYQQNRLIDTDYYIGLSVFNRKANGRSWFSVSIQNNSAIIFHEYFNIQDLGLEKALRKLKDCVDGLVK